MKENMIEFTLKDNVEKYISNNLEVLETSLDKAAQEYINLKSKENSLDFGKELTPKILEDLAPRVIHETRSFLDVQQNTDVSLSMFYLPEQILRSLKIAAGTFTLATLIGAVNGLTIQDLTTAGALAVFFGGGTLMYSMQVYSSSSFDYKNDLLLIRAGKTVNAIGAIAHEYTHYLQHHFTELNIQTRNPIVEGHARGMERIISEKFAQEFDNPAYVFINYDRVAKELKDTYLYTCKKKKILPKKSLENLPIPNIRGLLYSIDAHHYSIGVAAMTIACSKQGEKVYKDVMKNDFEFLRNP
ncbi:MAG: hypothetical protein Q8O03_06055 [Nanoarchaeota archaeon]|nr:hypothetical protein [Nanoarchaeota archaeon]